MILWITRENYENNDDRQKSMNMDFTSSLIAKLHTATSRRDNQYPDYK